MLVSVVVPAYNEEKYIGQCLDALRRQKHAGFDYEIIVVDNNSADRTAEVSRAAGARVVVQPRQGVAWARQAGFEAAAGEIIASTDADSAPPPDWLIRIVASFAESSDIVGVFGPLRVLDGNRFEDFAQCHLVGAFMWLSSALGRPTFIGSNFAVRRDAWVEVGGFDTTWVSAEDINLSLKLVKVGKVRFRRDMQVAASSRRRVEGYAGLMWHSWSNYFRVVWQGRPPLPFRNIR